LDFWERVRQRANRSLETLRASAQTSAKSLGDRSLLLKASTLVEAGTIPEHWLADALGAVVDARKRKPATKPFAYLQTVLQNRAQDDNRDWNRMLATVEVPEFLLKPRAAT
jgi:hypothetical protein